MRVALLCLFFGLLSGAQRDGTMEPAPPLPVKPEELPTFGEKRASSKDSLPYVHIPPGESFAGQGSADLDSILDRRNRSYAGVLSVGHRESVQYNYET